MAFKNGATLAFTCFVVWDVLSVSAVSITAHSPPLDLKKAFIQSLEGGWKKVHDHIELVKTPTRWLQNVSAWEIAQDVIKHKHPNGRKIGIEMHTRVRAHLSDWKNALGPVLQCPSGLLQTFGEELEGHHVCIDPALRTEGECIILSFGSANRFDFEVDVAKVRRDCKIHTFDCFMPGPPMVPQEIKNQTTFHNVCIRSKANTHLKSQKSYMTWDEIVTYLGLKQPPTILKMDIEGHEWEVMEDIAEASPVTKPNTVSLEMHFQVSRTHFLWSNVSSSYLTNWTQTMLSKGGYLLVDLEDTVVKHCVESALVRLA